MKQDTKNILAVVCSSIFCYALGHLAGTSFGKDLYLDKIFKAATMDDTITEYRNGRFLEFKPRTMD